MTTDAYPWILKKRKQMPLAAIEYGTQQANIESPGQILKFLVRVCYINWPKKKRLLHKHRPAQRLKYVTFIIYCASNTIL